MSYIQAVTRRMLTGLFALSVLLVLPLYAQDEPEAPPSPEIVAVSDPAIDQEALSILLVPLTAPQLSEVAANWQDIIQDSVSESAQINLGILNANEATAEKLRNDLENLGDEQVDLKKRYETVLNSWQQKGATEEELKPHTDYISGLTIGLAGTTDPASIWRHIKRWITSPDGGLNLLKMGVSLIIAIWVMMFVARLMHRLTGKGLSKVPTLSRLLKSFIQTAVYWGTFALGIMVVLAMLGVNVGPVFAVLGGLSFILAFALQDTLGNLASGLMIMILKPFDMGDFVETAGVSGSIDEMSMVSTTIRTFDNQIIIVPNSKIWGDVITNVNASPTRRVDMVFGIGYSDNIDEAIGILRKLVESHPKCLKDPAPNITVGELADNSVNILCRPWANTADYWTVYWDILRQAKDEFDAAGISIPFPQREVRVIKDCSDEEKSEA
ncbi:mechanosensitive ion channel family protein [Falsihalocynthiibacter sp. SS001]|uniref:mechanosensitive ion channel family protein n=1 Tax=Falsihalocynthiibacter sp. SS001 TaxID=3349698 RepID=UPI0036D3292E